MTDVETGKHYSAFQVSEVHIQIPDFSKKSGILLGNRRMNQQDFKPSP
jgi:hypothetical protein